MFNLAKIHLIIGIFFIPITLMFLITGGLYTAGIKGSYVTQKYEIMADGPVNADLSILEKLVKTTLAKKNIAEPSGSMAIKKAGTSWELEWSGSRADIVLAPTNDPGKLLLTIKHTTPHRFFVQLHKAKGGMVFKVFAIVFSCALLLLGLTGFIQARKMPKYKKLTLPILLGGIFFFIVLALLS